MIHKEEKSVVSAAGKTYISMILNLHSFHAPGSDWSGRGELQREIEEDACVICCPILYWSALHLSGARLNKLHCFPRALIDGCLLWAIFPKLLHEGVSAAEIKQFLSPFVCLFSSIPFWNDKNSPVFARPPLSWQVTTSVKRNRPTEQHTLTSLSAANKKRRAANGTPVT